MSCRQLDAERTIDTLQTLRNRIFERFGETSLAQVADELLQLVQADHEGLSDIERDNYVKLLRLAGERARTVQEIAETTAFFFADPEAYEEKGAAKFFSAQETADRLEALGKLLETSESFRADHLEKMLRGLAETQNIGAGKIIHPLRLALTGRTTSPGIFELMEILGPEKVRRRISRAIDYMDKPGDESLEN